MALVIALVIAVLVVLFGLTVPMSRRLDRLRKHHRRTADAGERFRIFGRFFGG